MCSTSEKQKNDLSFDVKEKKEDKNKFVMSSFDACASYVLAKNKSMHGDGKMEKIW